MIYYVRSKTNARQLLGCLSILPAWSKFDLSDEAVTGLLTMSATVEYQTDPPGPILNPSGKVWYPGFNSTLVDE